MGVVALGDDELDVLNQKAFENTEKEINQKTEK